MPIPVFVEFRGGLGNLHSAIGAAEADIHRLGRSSATSMQKVGVIGKFAAVAIIGTAAAVSVASIKMAADFQSQVMHLQTDAGESAKNMKMISDGILQLAGSTGTSTKDLINGMYYIESAGYHGAAGLTVLKAAAEGAKVGNADLTTVSDALTTALNSYHLGAGGATMVTNELIATVSSGKTKLEDLSGSLGTVLPAAATAKIGLDQVLGAMATMTAQGTNAHLAATYLRQTILQLENPTAKAATEMKALGLSSIDISKNLGKRGLTGTFDVLTSAIERKMGPAGVVLIDSLKKVSGNTTAYQKILANLPPTQQTYVAALANMVGGTKSMQAALELTGPSAKTFARNVQTIGAAAKDTSKGVKDWDVIQKTLNQRLEEVKFSVEALAIKLGTVLIPWVERAMTVIGAITNFLLAHRVAAIAVAGVIGGVLTIAFAAATVAVWGFTEALLTNPVTWIIVGIVAAVALLTVGIYELVTHWSTVWGTIKRISLDVWSALTHAWGNVEHAFSNVGAFFGAIGAGIAAAWASVQHAWGNVAHAWSNVIGFFRAAGGATVQAWENVQHAWTNVVHAWGNVIGFFRAAGGAVIHAWDNVVHAWGNVVHAVGNAVHFFKTAWHTVQSVTTTVWNSISGFFRKWWPLLLLIFFPPVAILIALWNHFHARVFAVAMTVWGAISGFLHRIWTVISTGAKVIWEAIYTRVAGPIQRIWETMVRGWTRIVSWVSGKWSQLVTVASREWSLITTVISGAFNRAWQVVVGVADRIGSWVSGKWSQLVMVTRREWDLVTSVISGVFNRAWQIVAGVARRIGAAVSLEWSTITGETSRAWNAITSAVRREFSMVIGVVTGIGGRVLSIIEGAFRGILSWLRGLGAEFFSIGVAIVNGIASGVTSAAGSIAGAVKNAANNALQSAKHFLGINSPSLLFHDLIGVGIGEGIALGIRNSSGLSAAAAIEHTRGALVAAQGALSPGAGISTSRQSTPRLHPDDIRALADAMTGLTVHMDGQKVGMVVRGNLLAAQKTRGLRIGLA